MQNLFNQWNLSDSEKIVTTHTSDVYKVYQNNGELAVLKHFNSQGKVDEAEGATLLKYYEGQGAVRVLQNNEDAVLLEYADGGELADIVYDGQDKRATDIMCDLVKQLHAERNTPAPTSLVPLERWFRDLFNAAKTSNDPLILKAAKVARELFETTTTNIPLHGDLHHSNVLKSNRGWLAIDPKGLMGDPCYDVSNIFGNPINAGDITTVAQRQSYLADTLSDKLGYPRDRLIKFAFIHSVISTIWSGSTAQDDAERVIIAKQLEPLFS